MKKFPIRFGAALAAAVLILTQALPAVGAADTLPPEETLSLSEPSPAAAASKCSCVTPCAEGSANGDCDVCAGDYTLRAKAGEKNGDPKANPETVPECICTSHCLDDFFASLQQCDVCMDDLTACKISPEPPKCICTLHCEDDIFASLQGCDVCLNDLTACKISPEPPLECICTLHCLDDVFASLQGCDVCMNDLTACTIKPDPPLDDCICKTGCTETSKNTDCPVCSEKYTLCQGCICPQFDDVLCTDALLFPLCPACVKDRVNCLGKKLPVCKCLIACGDLIDPDCTFCLINPGLCAKLPALSSVLQKKINAAASGAEIQITSAVEADQTVAVDKAVTLCVPSGGDNRGVAVSRTPELLDGPLFLVKSGSTLTLKDMTLDGSDLMSAHAPLVIVEAGGKLILSGNTVLANNENKDGNGGAVLSHGSVVMGANSLIESCEAGGGAGIFLTDGGSLAMEGSARISGNHATGTAGGVACAQGAQVRLSGGVQIQRNTAGGIDSNLVLGANPAVIESALTGSARIGVTTGGERAVAKRETGAVTNSDIAAFFSDEGLYITASGGIVTTVKSLQTVSGTVLMNGNPVQNAEVTIRDRDSGIVLSRTRTDNRGTYRIFQTQGNAPLRLTASAELGGKRYAAILDTKESARAFEPLSLRAGRLTSGKATGTSAVDAAVTAKDSAGKTVAADTADGGGLFDLILPEGGMYGLAAVNSGASGSGYADLSANEVPALEIAMANGSFATGKVLDNGKPASGVFVTLTPASRDLAAAPATAVTNALGEYEVGGVQPGAYTVTAHTSTGRTASGVTVNVAEGRVTPDVALGESLTVRGWAEYFKAMLYDEPPTGIRLEFHTPGGLKAGEAAVSEADGAFEVNLFPGDFYITAVYIPAPSCKLQSETPVMHVRADGTFSLDMPASDYDTPAFMPGRYDPSLPYIMINHPSAEFSGIWLDIQDLPQPDDPGLDLAPESELVKRIIRVNQFYKRCSPIEQDMLPRMLEEQLNGLLKLTADKYKVRVTTSNQAPSILSGIASNLGEGEQVSETAQHIAADVGAAAGLSGQEAEIDLKLTAQPPSADGINAIEKALTSGDIVDYFDLNLSASYQSGGIQGTRPVTEAGESIEISVSLADFSESEGEYSVIRRHGDEVTVLDARYEGGKIIFETDRFSTYAIAYALPGKGVVIETAPPDSSGGTGGQSEKNSSGSGAVSVPSSPIIGSGGQYQFWLDTRDQLKKAAAGTSVTVDAKDYTMMPSTVLQAVAGKDITLIIELSDGSSITLNGKKIKLQKGILYYSFEELRKLMEQDEKESGQAAEDVQTAEAVQAAVHPAAAGSASSFRPNTLTSPVRPAQPDPQGVEDASTVALTNTGTRKEIHDSASSPPAAEQPRGMFWPLAGLAAALTGYCAYRVRRKRHEERKG